MKFKIIFLSIIFFISGFVLFFFKKEWLIFNFNHTESKVTSHVVLKRELKIYFWKDMKFFSENIFVIWKDDNLEDLKFLINSWLSFIYEEQFIDRKSSLETVMLSPKGTTVYLSFDSNIVSTEWSIQKKWNTIEGLLKTIRESFSNVTEIFFLVKHKPMQDEHLDFSVSWPIGGFLEQ